MIEIRENMTYAKRMKIVKKIIEEQEFEAILVRRCMPSRPEITLPKKYKNCKFIIIPIEEEELKK